MIPESKCSDTIKFTHAFVFKTEKAMDNFVANVETENLEKLKAQFKRGSARKVPLKGLTLDVAGEVNKQLQEK